MGLPTDVPGGPGRRPKPSAPTDWLGWGGLALDTIGTVGSLLGLGDDEDRQFRNDQFYNAVKVRVGDAKAAGIHPLYALGSGVSHSPVSYVGQKPGLGAVRSLGKDLARMGQSREGKRAAAINEELVRSQIRLNDARAVAALGSRARPQAASDPNQLTSAGTNPLDDQWRRVGPPVPSARSKQPDVTSGPTKGQPMYTKFQTPFGFPLYGMQSSEGASEAFSLETAPMWIWKNFDTYSKWMIENYGKWGKKAAKRLWNDPRAKKFRQNYWRRR